MLIVTERFREVGRSRVGEDLASDESEGDRECGEMRSRWRDSRLETSINGRETQGVSIKITLVL